MMNFKEFRVADVSFTCISIRVFLLPETWICAAESAINANYAKKGTRVNLVAKEFCSRRTYNDFQKYTVLHTC